MKIADRLRELAPLVKGVGLRADGQYVVREAAATIDDLLAALKGLYETGAPDGLALTAEEMQARFDAARKAIAKAEGR
ncbi:MAG: hypothetical protein ACK5XN_18855 [Bacteroidota bacterium]